MDATLNVAVNSKVSLLVNADNLLNRTYHLYTLAQPRTVYAGLRFHLF